MFKKTPMQALPKFGTEGEHAPFILTTDFSGTALGASLSQMQGGDERFIAAAGRKTTKDKQNYGSVKGELTAAIYCTCKFEHILKFAPFILHTDTSALQYLKTLKSPKGIMLQVFRGGSSVCLPGDSPTGEVEC